jgi:hypothetical protein
MVKHDFLNLRQFDAFCPLFVAQVHFEKKKPKRLQGNEDQPSLEVIGVYDAEIEEIKDLEEVE